MKTIHLKEKLICGKKSEAKIMFSVPSLNNCFQIELRTMLNAQHLNFPKHNQA